MNHTEIGELIAKIRNQDQVAAEKLYFLLAKNLYYYAYKLLGNQEDASDAVQEAWLSFYRKLNSLQNPTAAMAYLKRTLHNHCMDVLRKSSGVLIAEDSELELEESEELDEEFLPEHFALNQERQKEIADMVSLLPETQRAVVILYYFDQISTKEISAILEIDESAVYNRLTRARKTLRQQLDSKEGSYSMAMFVLTQALEQDAAEVMSSIDLPSEWDALLTAQKGSAVATADTPPAEGFSRIFLHRVLPFAIAGLACLAIVAMIIGYSNRAANDDADAFSPSSISSGIDLESPLEADIIDSSNQESGTTPSSSTDVDHSSGSGADASASETEAFQNGGGKTQTDTPPAGGNGASGENGSVAGETPVREETEQYALDPSAERETEEFSSKRGYPFDLTWSEEITLQWKQNEAVDEEQLWKSIRRQLWPAISNEQGTGFSVPITVTITNRENISLAQKGTYPLTVQIEFQLDGTDYQFTVLSQLEIK